jgi:Nuclease A inhibitor-like protein
MESNQSDILLTDSDVQTNWQQKVTDLLKDLTYPSESDEVIDYVSFKVSVAPPLTMTDVLFYLGYPPSVTIEEISPELFWQPLTQTQDWFGEFELAQVKIFEEIKTTMTDRLVGQQCFRVGRNEIDLYWIGQLSEKEWGGLKTKLVET